MVTESVFGDVCVTHRRSGHLFDHFECFQDRATVRLASTNVVDLSATRLSKEDLDEPRHIHAVNVVANLFALVTEHSVLSLFQIAFDQVTQKAMQFHSRMIRPGQAAGSQAAGWHSEVSSVLLNNNVGGKL